MTPLAGMDDLARTTEGEERRRGRTTRDAKIPARLRKGFTRRDDLEGRETRASEQEGFTDRTTMRPRDRRRHASIGQVTCATSRLHCLRAA